ncbi:hypothetical protein Nepgr_011068 [Nepenthes gracilis]|uniref:Aluminum-activated malate transporter 12-like n=1 Tax=Nepenthes gracilis TaxID=150966 RepID=A0AAD3SDI8_NEPGR|nr:hypothetical protein Nepgr_011068 [Nepenthes gracilis]
MGIESKMAGKGDSGQSKQRMKNQMQKMKKWPDLLRRTVWKVGREDPRRVIHSFKVGLSLTLVSLLYLLEPFFKGIGQNAIWAVMTVVVVLEFTAGATLCKGLNRGFGTLLAVSLAFLIEFIPTESDGVFRAIFIGTAVFVVGTVTTYIRFIPYIKKNYDYGVLIFLLTFNLITVSSFRLRNVLKIAHERLYTIAIGCGICLFMSLLVFPIWSGHDLHTSSVSKLEDLAKSIEACVHGYFDDSGDTGDSREELSNDPIYKAVMDSKYTDETLALYASWEPRHSRHCYRFPWQQYVKLGAVLRHFGYTVVAMHGCLETEIQTPKSVRALFRDPSIRLAGEVSKVLRELANSIRHRRHCSPELLSDHLHQALQDLDTALKSQPKLFLSSNNNYANMSSQHAMAADQKPGNKERGVLLSSVKTDTSALLEWKRKRGGEQAKEAAAERTMLRPTLSKMAITSLEFAEALPFAAFASMLVETVARLDLVIEEVDELARNAHFQEFKPDGAYEVVVTAERALQNHLPSHGVE